MVASRRRTLTWFAAVSFFVLLVFNVFQHALENVQIPHVNVWFVIPFLILLASIAIMPFLNRHWWEKNYPIVSYTLGIIVIIYYVLSLQNIPRVFLTAYEYISFISLIGSLFVVSGGIHIRIRGKSTPWANVALLGTGAVVANVLGTTGASMILIRPYLRMNRYRIRPYHVVFFIFIVSNIGGALTPIGDPPLFLGYLKGIPFFWIITRVSHIWALTLGILLLVFFIIDYSSYAKQKRNVHESEAHIEEPEVNGLHNIVFLAIIVGAVFIEKPVMVREIIMWSAALASLYTTRPDIHEKNEFNFLPIKEVAILFAGIFATMIPALDWLELNAEQLGVVTPAQYFWASGALSSFLDNAPTYLNFLSAAFGLHGANVDNVHHMQAMLGLASAESLGLSNPLKEGAFLMTADTWKYVQAISLGAVFFGANTYIGNGPNFMVKSIAEQAKVECPSFFGYVFKYTIPVLIPTFAVVWYFFLR